jgi:hypothetical protein
MYYHIQIYPCQGKKSGVGSKRWDDWAADGSAQKG